MTEGSTIWTGWDRRSRSAPADDVPFHSGPRRAAYELLALAGRGFRPPQFLTVDDANGEAHDVPDSVRPVWSLEYRLLMETAPRAVEPYAVYLLGVDPPDDLDDNGLATFNDFYSTVHLLEVAERRHALRAARFELVATRRAPYPSAPRFLATYEVDEEGSANRRHRGPPYSKGPEVWQRHTTPWRLWFRRLPSGAGG